MRTLVPPITVKKDPYVEQWNGVREDWHKSYTLLHRDHFGPTMVMTVLVPVLIYTAVRTDQDATDKQRNKPHDYF